MIDDRPMAVVAPLIEIALVHCIGREILGQQAPLKAGLADIEDRIDRLAEICRPRPPASARRRKMWLDRRPFPVVVPIA